jgi:hypothetical protein
MKGPTMASVCVHVEMARQRAFEASRLRQRKTPETHDDLSRRVFGTWTALSWSTAVRLPTDTPEISIRESSMGLAWCYPMASLHLMTENSSGPQQS